LGVITAAPWQFQVPAGRLPDGPHVLSAKATDPSNNSATSPVVHVTVSNVTGTGGSGGGSGGSAGSGSGGSRGNPSVGVEGGCACDSARGNPSGSLWLLALGAVIATGSRLRIGRRRIR